jgi:uncharacterized protein (DUF1501 family)
MSISRRQFFVGCSAAIAAMAGSRINGLVFDDPHFSGSALAQTAGPNEVLVVVFLRGGCDTLSLVSPYDDPNYRTARMDGSNLGLALPASPAAEQLFAINNPAFQATSNFCFHPQAVLAGSSLRDLYNDQKLAIVHAAGLNDDTRSHFDAMDYIERGTPGNKNTGTGWLMRHLQSINAAGDIPALAANSAAPASLLSYSDAIALTDPRNFRINNGAWGRYNNEDNEALLNALDRMYSGSDIVSTSGRGTIEAIKKISARAWDQLNESNDFKRALLIVGQIITAGMGLRVATVDLGGWDHHESQGVNETYGPFYNLSKKLAEGLTGLANDAVSKGYWNNLTVVVMSEFGRRLGRNASGGTDHGHGGAILVMGGKVNGGKMYGRWPGLAREQLDQSQDLAVTTDYRTVLSEAVTRVLGNPKLGSVFPGITPEIYSAATALNIFQGTDPEIDYTSSGYQAFLPLVAR